MCSKPKKKWGALTPKRSGGGGRDPETLGEMGDLKPKEEWAGGGLKTQKEMEDPKIQGKMGGQS